MKGQLIVLGTLVALGYLGFHAIADHNLWAAIGFAGVATILAEYGDLARTRKGEEVTH